MERLGCDPNIHYNCINLLTEYDFSSFHSFTEIFDFSSLQRLWRYFYEIFEGTDERTDGGTVGQTDRRTPVYPPLFQSGDVKI